MDKNSRPADHAPATEGSGANAKLLASGRDLAALLAVTEVATQSLEIEKILNDTLDKSLEILGFDLGFIRILDEEKTGMVVRAARGLRSPEFLAGVTPVQSDRRNVSRIVFETKEPYVCSDIRKNPIYKNRTLEREGVISTAAAPVMSKTRVLGLIVVGSRRYHRFARREIRLLNAFGSQLGVALENAQLYLEIAKGKAYVENLVENAADLIVGTDLDDRIQTWNRGAEVLAGYCKSEIIGQNISVLFAPEERRRLEEIRVKVLLTGPLRDLELRATRKNGELLYLSVSVSPIRDENGRILGLLSVGKDISEKKKVERRLKEVDRLKSDFVSNVSHELRTPLTAIKASVDNMLDGLTGPLTEKQTRYLSRIKSNADRLGRLIADLLDLSRIEAGKVALHPASLNAGQLTAEAAETLRPAAAEKLIELEVTLPEEPVFVWADRDKTIQVLINLLGNAIKFTPPRGLIRAGVEDDGSGWIKLWVEDTGPGIPEEQSVRIFDKFYQAEQSNRPKTAGTGLGLSISKSLVEMHGGRIWVERSARGGSRFCFTLPARAPLGV
ncbi:MAG TPA: ATP-binding protein [candidate division Zixibacteria bacterium]|nr:ATP-binding protein [candidate division Zixibacteria bacterium]